MDETLSGRLATLAPVPPPAAEAYRGQGPQLIAAVDAALESRADRAALIGPNPLAIAFDNHANHWRFMSNVFRLNSVELLVSVLPWVYHAYGSRGFSLDYFPFVLETYKQAVLDQLSADHAAPIAAVYDDVRAQHALIAELSQSDTRPPPIEATWLARVQEFCDVLLAADTRRALALTAQWVKEPEDIPNFFQIVVTGVMIEIGQKWEANQISVAQEHLATSLVNRVMASLYPKILSVAPRRGRALVTCAPNEFHEVGSRMFADLLELDGWDVQYLGTNTPVADLVALLQTSPVRFLALSVAMPFNLDQAGQAITEISKLGPSRPKILLGGRAFSLAPRLWQEIGGDAYCPTAQAGVAIARSWSQEGAA